MKYYYLLNGKIMSANEKMPENIGFKSGIGYESHYKQWLNGLQQCKISESELEKVVKHLNAHFGVVYSGKSNNNPIEVTDIVEEKDYSSSEPNPMLFFKQPSDNNGVITFKANKNMKKPLVIEVCTDNGEFSHWSLIDLETSEKLWSENPEECKAMGYPVKQPKQVEEIEAVKLQFFKEFGSQSFRGYPLEQCHSIWDFFKPHLKRNI